jgi:hypothetical protein
MHRILFVILAAFLCGAPSCKSLVRDVRNIETLDDTQFGRLQAKCSAIVSLGLGPIVRKGGIEADKLEQIAGTMDALGAGVLSPEPGGFVADVLRREGFTDQEILGVFLLLEDALKDAGVDLSFAQPGPRTAALLHTLADAVRGAAPETEVAAD